MKSNEFINHDRNQIIIIWNSNPNPESQTNPDSNFSTIVSITNELSRSHQIRNSMKTRISLMNLWKNISKLPKLINWSIKLWGLLWKVRTCRKIRIIWLEDYFFTNVSMKILGLILVWFQLSIPMSLTQTSLHPKEVCINIDF